MNKGKVVSSWCAVEMSATHSAIKYSFDYARSVQIQSYLNSCQATSQSSESSDSGIVSVQRTPSQGDIRIRYKYIAPPGLHINICRIPNPVLFPHLSGRIEDHSILPITSLLPSLKSHLSDQKEETDRIEDKQDCRGEKRFRR
jgi:hypothetical protein